MRGTGGRTLAHGWDSSLLIQAAVRASPVFFFSVSSCSLVADGFVRGGLGLHQAGRSIVLLPPPHNDGRTSPTGVVVTCPLTLSYCTHTHTHTYTSLSPHHFSVQQCERTFCKASAKVFEQLPIHPRRYSHIPQTHTRDATREKVRFWYRAYIFLPPVCASSLRFKKKTRTPPSPRRPLFDRRGPRAPPTPSFPDQRCVCVCVVCRYLCHLGAFSLFSSFLFFFVSSFSLDGRG